MCEKNKEFLSTIKAEEPTANISRPSTKDEPPEAAQNEAENKDLAKDASSELFDPLQALYADDLRISKKQPPVQFQNIAAFDTALKTHGVWGLQQNAGKATAGSSKKVVTEVTTKRRFQPHQMPVRAPTNAKPAHTKNLLRWLEEVDGPLKLLVDAMKTEKLVRVVVRNEHGVRGYMHGIIISFDRHWNLLLKDVVEVWRRRKFNFGVNNCCAADNPPQNCSEVLAELGITLPELSVKSLNRKNVEITRKLAQLFIRGEQIVLINVVENKV